MYNDSFSVFQCLVHNILARHILYLAISGCKFVKPVTIWYWRRKWHFYRASWWVTLVHHSTLPYPTIELQNHTSLHQGHQLPVLEFFLTVWWYHIVTSNNPSAVFLRLIHLKMWNGTCFHYSPVIEFCSCYSSVRWTKHSFDEFIHALLMMVVFCSEHEKTNHSWHTSWLIIYSRRLWQPHYCRIISFLAVVFVCTHDEWWSEIYHHSKHRRGITTT